VTHGELITGLGRADNWLQEMLLGVNFLQSGDKSCGLTQPDSAGTVSSKAYQPQSRPIPQIGLGLLVWVDGV